MAKRILDDRYTILRKLGVGSTGTVYLVRQVGDKRQLALKILNPSGAVQQSAQNLRDEFALLSQLDHPHVVKIQNFGLTSKKKPYLVMEYIDGPSFDQSLVKKISEADFCSILVDICLALEYIHSYGLVHQDIKPTNILLQSRSSKPPLAKLVDFGLATTGVAGGGAQLSGTLEYFAPELIRGGAVDGRADLYSLGVTLYEVITGENPFRADDPRQILRHHLDLTPEPPRALNSSISPAVERIVLKLLEKDPLDRFPTASAVIENLRREADYQLSTEQKRSSSILPPSQFVGRAAELSKLRAWYQEMRRGKNSLVFLEGDYGIGKTRLLREFAVSCQLQGTAVIGDGWGGGVIGQLERRGSAGEMGRVDSISADLGAADYRAWELACRQISQFSQAPLFIIEDLHEKDANILSFIDYLLDRLSGLQMMICASFQKSLLDAQKNSLLRTIKRRRPGVNVHTLQLQPLSKNDLTQMIRSRFQMARGESQLITYLNQRSNGNPLFVEEFITTLRAHGVLIPGAKGWSLDGAKLSRIQFPQAIQDINRLAVKNITAEVKALLSAAAVLGEPFRLEDLRAVSSLAEGKLYASLGTALRRGLISREAIIIGEPRYYFAKAGLRELLYKAISSKARKELHRKIALRLEKQPPRSRDLIALAEHYHRAEDYHKSAEYSPQAAQKALADSRMEQANTYLRFALQAKQAIGQQKQLIPILEALGDNNSSQGRYKQGLAFYNQALELLGASKSGPYFDLQRKRAILLRRQSQFGRALTILRKTLKDATGPRTSLPRARLLAELGWVKRMKSDYQGALEDLQESLRLLRWGRDRTDTARVLNNLGVVSWTLGRYQEAQAYYERALKIYQELGDQEKLAALLDNLGLTYLSQGQTDRAVNMFEESLHLRKSSADVFGEAKACHNLAMAFAEGGDWDRSIAFYLQSQMIKGRIKDRDGLALTLNNLGILYMHRGLWNEAERCQKEALGLRRKMQNKYGLSGSYDNLGDLAMHRGNWKAARQDYQRAQRIRREIKDHAGSCFSLLNLGRLDLEQGYTRKAHKNLMASRACFEKSADRVGLMHADLALAECYLSLRELATAREYGAQTLSQAEEIGNRFLEARAAGILAVILAFAGEEAPASELSGRSIELLKGLQARYELAKAFFLSGLIKQRGFKVREAIRYYKESLIIFQRLGVKHFMSRIEKQLESLQASLDHQENTELFTLYTMSEILNSMKDIDLLLEKVLDLAVELLHAERGAIIFYDHETDDFQIKIARSMEIEAQSDALEISRSTVKSVAQEGKPVVVDNALQDKEFSRWQSVTMYNIMSILCVPLKIRGKVIGTIYLDNRTVPGIFSTRDVSFLESFSNLTALAIENAQMYSELHGENIYLKGQLESKYKHENIVGNSKAMQDIFNVIERVSPSRATVLILGASGTGKELVARLIHFSSLRSDKPFLKVNCAALPESLLESELFGIEEKIATGVKSRKGKFELAEGGTIFLDEIGDMSVSTQAKVLRVLQEREFERVGGSKTIKVDVRIISATNQDLQQAIAERSFRKDLFYRLNTVAINIPPLRERKEDIPFLIDHFVKKYCLENEREQIVVSAAAMDAFMRYDWPGNVRELENYVQRGVVMAEGKSFPMEFVPSIVEVDGEEVTFSVPAGHRKLDQILGHIERTAIEKALREHSNVQVKAASALGLSEGTLRYKMRKYGISK